MIRYLKRGRDVQVLVGVDAAGDDEVVGCQSGHGPSFSLASSGAGTARAEGRTGQGRACCSRLLLGHFIGWPCQAFPHPADGSLSRQPTAAGLYQGQTGRENTIIEHPCLYLVTRSLDPTGRGRARWTMRWKPALNAFAITFSDRWPALRPTNEDRRKHRC